MGDYVIWEPFQTFATREDALAWLILNRGGNGSIEYHPGVRFIDGQRHHPPSRIWDVKNGLLIG